MRRIGIDAAERMVDSAQFQSRLKSFDFDLITQRYTMQINPGVEIRAYWASDFADVPGSRNLPGIANPAIDTLINQVIEAPTRDEQIIAARALDRVLRAGRYWVPQWYKASYTIAYWDLFDRPETAPLYDRGVLRTWWVDQTKAQKLGIDPLR